MTDETIVIENLPDVQDINVMLEAISGIGARVERIDRHKVSINGSMINDFSVDYEYIKKIRGILLSVGSYVRKIQESGRFRFREAATSGSRPIDLHLKRVSRRWVRR